MWNQYVKHSDMRVLPVGRTLRMVTIDAAKALGLDDQIGSLELGKKADIIMIDLDKPHLTPQTFIPNLLANYVNGYDVDTVMVDGEILMEATNVKSVNVSQVLENARSEAEKSYQYIDLKNYTSTEETFWRGLRWE
jgi:cytosine/adenosine deaminase-related metal-dependent hydrolase